jgi:hypothetical protein
LSWWLNGGLAATYAASFVGLHRWAVYRRRRQADGFPTLAWLDWDTLLQGLGPPGESISEVGPQPLEGGPAPLLLARPAPDGLGPRFEVLGGVVSGGAVDVNGLPPTLFSAGERAWLKVLVDVRKDPVSVLAQLEGTPPTSVAEAYLREVLSVDHLANAVTLELLVFSSKRRLKAAIARFGDHAALHFARARASSLLGAQHSVLDDLARAVYFSRQAPFYVAAVAGLPYVAKARPALARACQEAVRQRASRPRP